MLNEIERARRQGVVLMVLGLVVAMFGATLGAIAERGDVIHLVFAILIGEAAAFVIGYIVGTEVERLS